jgi:hypothetical protein
LLILIALGSLLGLLLFLFLYLIPSLVTKFEPLPITQAVVPEESPKKPEDDLVISEPFFNQAVIPEESPEEPEDDLVITEQFFAQAVVPEESPKEPEGDLVIPEHSIENNDLSFLEGCWISDSNLINFYTKLPVVVKYCFDNVGHAVTTLDEKDKNGNLLGVCSTTGRARFEDGNLIFENNGPICPYNNTQYSKKKVVCVPMKDGRVDCNIIQPGLTASATMKRSK